MYDLLKEYFSDKEEYNIEIEDNYFYIENLTENSGNKFTALKLEYVKSSLDSDLDVDVYDESGNVIGFLCLLKENQSLYLIYHLLFFFFFQMMEEIYYFQQKKKMI